MIISWPSSKTVQPTFTGEVDNYTFSLFDDAPLLNYTIHVETGKQYAVEYRNYNNAPEFEQGFTENNDNTFDLAVKNISAYDASDFWVSPSRQLPMIRMVLKLGSNRFYGTSALIRKEGMVYANPPYTDYTMEKKLILDYTHAVPNPVALLGTQLRGTIQERFYDLMKKRRELPFDSMIAETFYLYRYASMLDVAPNTAIEDVTGRAKQPVNVDSRIYDFGALLRTRAIEFNIVLATSCDGPAMDGVLSSRDIDWMLLMGDKKSFFGINDIFSPAFYIPYQLENTDQAITFNQNENSDVVPRSQLSIPGSSPANNSRTETLHIAIAGNNTDLQVDRRTVLKGHYKADVQKDLILFEDYCNAERKLFGEDKTIIEELEDRKSSRKSYAAELKAAFDKERSLQKDKFVNEAKDWFDQPVTDLTDYKVENLGVRHNNPDFVYSSKFNLGGLVKKAGNNLVIEIGKLQGATIKASPDLRKRKLDVYMPFARSINSQITLQIPDGYTAEGIAELNKKIVNSSGHFIVEANSDAKTITISIKKSYNHSYESIANWDKMIEFIEAASEWTNAKILLKKK